jgi:hypothetical protein
MKKADIEKIIEQTNYLPETVTIKYRKWVLAGNTPKTCPSCGNYILPQNVYCSKKCSANSPTTKQARKETNLSIYGDTNGKLPDEILQKRRKLAEERYGEGIIHHNQAAVNKEKIEKTNMEKYGVKSTLKHTETLDKIKQTNLELYGAENPFASKVIQEKIKQINFERYGDENPTFTEEIKEKTKQTNIDRYGTPFNSQRHFSKEALEKWNDEEWLREQYSVLKKSVAQIARELDIGHVQLVQRYHDIGIEVKRHRLTTIEKENYYLDIKSWTEKSWRQFQQQIISRSLYQERGVECHLDHIYSKHEGYLNNVPAEVIGHWTNLRLIPADDNVSKRAASHKTLEELWRDYDESIVIRIMV